MEVALDLDLPIHSVSLPAPEDFSRPIAVDSDIARVAQDYEGVPDSFAVEAGVFHGENLNVSWKVLHKGRALELSPLEFEAARLQGDGCQVKLLVPAVVLPHCVAITDAGADFVVDFVTDSGYLYTVLVPHQWLRQGDRSPSAGPAKTPVVRMTRQHSLDLVAPRILKAVSAHTLLMALVNGTLLRLDRPSPHDPLTPLTLSNPLGKPREFALARLFRPTTDKVPGHPRLSVHAAASVEVVGDTAITYAVDNSVQVWSLVSNSCVQSIPADTGSTAWRLRPTTYIAHSGPTVAIAYPNTLKIYELSHDRHNDSDRKPESEPTLQSVATVPIPQDLTSWFVTSLGILGDKRLLVSFKLDLCAQVYLVSAEGQWTNVGGYDHSSLLDLPISNSLTRIKQKVMETNPAVVKLALSQLTNSSLAIDPDQTAASLIQSLEDRLNALLDNDTADIKSQWLRLDTLCREIEAQGGELLTIAPALSTGSGMFFWSLRVSGVTIFCIADGISSTDPAREDAMEIGQELLGNVTPAALDRVCEIMLSDELLVDRIEGVCGVLRKFLHQKKLNDMGRTIAGRVAAALRSYVAEFGPAAPEAGAGPTTQLSQLGKDAVNMLVYDYATTYCGKFRLVVSLASIALVEGWLNGRGDSDLVMSVVEVLRRYSFISRLGLKHLHLEVDNICLENFGISLARNITYHCDEVGVLRQLLPPKLVDLTPDVMASFDRAVAVCHPTPEMALLRSMASLASGDETKGIALAQRISLARPWPAQFGARPASQAAWLAEMAKYARSVGADGAAFCLAQFGESLVAGSDPSAPALHEQLFDLAIKAGNVAVAYSALTRRFPSYRDSPQDEALAQAWINELIGCAARNSDEEARTLVVAYPFIGFAQDLQQALATSASFATVPSYKLRYAWYIEREDFVGAAQVVYQQIREDGSGDYARRAELYTVCLNALSLAAPESRWLNNGGVVVHFDDVKLQQDALLKQIVDQIQASGDR